MTLSKEQITKRRAICQECPKRADKQCGICKCYIFAMTIAKRQCPDTPPRW